MAKYAFDRCMLCESPPVVEVLWAEGMGRAWFCEGCYGAWKVKHPGEVVSERMVEDGVVPERWGRREKDHRPTGTMVAFYLPRQVADQLTMTWGMFGEDDEVIQPEDMHLTLAYLGGDEGVPMGDLHANPYMGVIEEFAESRLPLHGMLGGTGQFTGHEEDGRTAYYVSVDCAELSNFRQALVGVLGPSVSRMHGFMPHVTLAYSAKPLTNVPVPFVPVCFSELVVARGDERTVYPLRGGERLETLEGRLEEVMGELPPDVVEGLHALESKRAGGGDLLALVQEVLGLSPESIALLLEGD